MRSGCATLTTDLHQARLGRPLPGCRFEQRKLDSQSDILRIGKLTPVEHAALAGLLGRPQRFASSMSVDLRAIDTALQNAGIANSLRDALEELDGPLTHLPTARADAQARWQEVVDSCTHPRLVERLRDRPRWVCSSVSQAVALITHWTYVDRWRLFSNVCPHME